MFAHRSRSPRRFVFVAASIVAFAAVGCGETKTETASGDANPPATENAALNAASGDKGTADKGIALSMNAGRASGENAAADPLAEKPLVVPENATPEELVEFLRKAATTRILGKTEEEYVAKATQRATAVATAAEKILAAQATPAARYEAAANKFNALQDLRQLAAPDADANYLAFAAEIPQIVDGIFKEQTTDEALRSQAIALKLNALFTAASQSDAAAAEFANELQSAAADKDPGVVNVARQIDVHFQMARLISEKESDPATLVAAVKSAVSVDEPDPEFFSQARDIVAELEQRGQTDAASAIAEAVGTAYGRFDNEHLAEVAKLWAESVKRRLTVIGSQIEIDGVLASGESFDLTSLRGKVVLIDFWATWCQPCLRLLPELEALHAEYHGQGFEIVGVSLDNERAALDQFLAQRKLPWPILANVVGKPPTTPEQNAERYGVEAIPVVILVDKQGKAVATGLHGDALAERVKQLLSE